MSNNQEKFFSGISKLEGFLSKVQSSEIFNTFLYEQGILIVKLRTERLDDAEKATEFFELMASYPALKKYMKAVLVEPYKCHVTSYSNLEYKLKISDIKEAKLTKNLEALVLTLERIEDVEVSRNNKEVIIDFKTIADPDKAIKFIKMFFPLLEKLKLRPYMETKMKNPTSEESIGYRGHEYRIDLTAFLTDYHKTRLQNYYELNKEDLTKSMSFLLQCGWDEKQFNSIGVSRATFYRIKAEKQENNQSQVRQQQN